MGVKYLIAMSPVMSSFMWYQAKVSSALAKNGGMLNQVQWFSLLRVLEA